MSKTGAAIRFAAVVATVVLLSAGCAAGGAQAPSGLVSGRISSSGAGPIHTGMLPPPSEKVWDSSPLGSGGRLIVLADGIAGGLGLWALDPGSQWTALASTPDAAALGRTADGVAIAAGHQIDARSRSGLSASGSVTTLKWPGAAPAAPIASLDSSPAGRLAIVTADEQSLDYAVAASDGTVTTLTPAPTQSFTPLVAWLDETHLLVLTTDNQQVSRLAVVDTGAQTMKPATAMGDLRVFALSSDRQTIAVATEAAIYAGPVAAFLGGTPPPPIAALDAAEVVWGLALDSDGSKVFALAGRMAPDGKVGALHEIGYASEDSGWTKVLDSSAPFGRALSQVYMP